MSEDNENIWQSYKLRDMQYISRGFSLQCYQRDGVINASLITDSYESVGNQTCFSHFSYWENEVLSQYFNYKVGGMQGVFGQTWGTYNLLKAGIPLSLCVWHKLKKKKHVQTRDKFGVGLRNLGTYSSRQMLGIWDSPSYWVFIE